MRSKRQIQAFIAGLEHEKIFLIERHQHGEVREMVYITEMHKLNAQIKALEWAIEKKGFKLN